MSTKPWHLELDYETADTLAKDLRAQLEALEMPETETEDSFKAATDGAIVHASALAKTRHLVSRPGTVVIDRVEDGAVFVQVVTALDDGRLYNTAQIVVLGAPAAAQADEPKPKTTPKAVAEPTTRPRTPSFPGSPFSAKEATIDNGPSFPGSPFTKKQAATPAPPTTPTFPGSPFTKIPEE